MIGEKEENRGKKTEEGRGKRKGSRKRQEGRRKGNRKRKENEGGENEKERLCITKALFKVAYLTSPVAISTYLNLLAPVAGLV